MKILSFLQTQTETFIIVLGGLLILLVASIDYITGSDLSFSVFYLIPIAMVAWLSNKQYIGIIASFVAAIIWLIVDITSRSVYSSDAIPFWNAGVRLGFFLIVTYTLSSLRTARARQEELGHFIVHDLRSPLSNIVIGLDFLLNTSEGLDNDQTQIIQLSIASSNRMMTLLNSLLDLAKLESGQLHPVLKQTSIRTLFDATLQQVSAIALHSEVTVVYEVADTADDVMADDELIVRVLVNLVSNAIKYSPKDTTVLMKAEMTRDGMVAIHVIDKGTGIPKEWADKVFDKFTQVEIRDDGRVGGTGLGLTFCKLAIEAHGGRIWITSETEIGTTMTFTLPRS